MKIKSKPGLKQCMITGNEFDCVLLLRNHLGAFNKISKDLLRFWTSGQSVIHSLIASKSILVKLCMLKWTLTTWAQTVKQPSVKQMKWRLKIPQSLFHAYIIYLYVVSENLFGSFWINKWDNAYNVFCATIGNESQIIVHPKIKS